MSTRSTTALAALLTLAACASRPEYAVFPPLAATPPGERVARDHFSLLVPHGWQVVDDERDALWAREDPPPNGRWRVYRSLRAQHIAFGPVAPGVDVGALALAQLRQQHADDDLVVAESGRTQLAERDAWFVRGRIRGGSAELFLDVLEFLVPCDGSALWLSCQVPAGQLEASRQGFAALAASLQTDLAPPSSSVGVENALAGGRLAIRPPSGWETLTAGEGTIAAFASADGASRCEVATEPHGDGLAALAARYVADHAATWPDLRVLAIDRSPAGDRPRLRLCSVYRGEHGALVVDATWCDTGTGLDRVQFVVPVADYPALRAKIDDSLASLRWR